MKSVSQLHSISKKLMKKIIWIRLPKWIWIILDQFYKQNLIKFNFAFTNTNSIELMRIYHLHVFFIVKINQAYSFFLLQHKFFDSRVFSTVAPFLVLLEFCDCSFEPSPLVRSCNAFLLFSAFFLVVLVLLVSCMHARCLLRVEGTQFESCEEEDRDARTRVEDSEQLLYGFKVNIFLDHILS